MWHAIDSAHTSDAANFLCANQWVKRPDWTYWDYNDSQGVPNGMHSTLGVLYINSNLTLRVRRQTLVSTILRFVIKGVQNQYIMSISELVSSDEFVTLDNCFRLIFAYRGKKWKYEMYVAIVKTTFFSLDFSSKAIPWTELVIIFFL